jgi:cellulose synthase/poly-beta-1,6-N-acetylglucosamine synthase-like glycosyltransferase
MMMGFESRFNLGFAVIPLVSVLLPAFNAERTLAACLRSVERQSERSWECIVVDDGSSDGTLACARAFATRDRRFVATTLGSHRGLVAALNHGLGLCRGRFVARMDSDDVMHRARLANQVRALVVSPELAAVGSHVRFFPRGALREGLRAYEAWLNGIDSPQRVREDAFVECPIAHPTLMIHRDLLAKLRYRDRGWPEDYDLVLRLLARGHAIGVVPERLLSWRAGPERLSMRSPTYGVDRFTACKAAFLASGFLARSHSYVLWGYGHTGRALRRALLAQGKEPSHVVELHPGRLGNTIHGAPVVSPEVLGRIPRRPVVVSVAGVRARTEIRAALARLGFVESRDFVCAA